LTACANDFARTHKRQTITANDVLAAIKELDFDDFSTDMMSFLESYRVSEKHKKDAKAKAAADKKERDDDGSKETPSKQEDEENDDDDDDNDNEAKDDDDDDDEENSDRKRHRNDDDDDNTAAESPKHSPETESVEEPTLKKAKLGENVNAKDDTETGGKAGTGADEDETAE
jgi:archaellum component FlaD/FlaE